MSNKEENKSTATRDKAIERIRAVVGKHKILKVPMLVNDVIKHVFGDLSKDETKADKAFKNVSNLLAAMVDAGEFETMTFTKSNSIENGDETVTSLITETIILEQGFAPTGYSKDVLTTVDENPAVDEGPADEDDTVTSVDGDDEDGDEDEDSDSEIFDSEVNALIHRHCVGFAIVNNKENAREITIKHDATSALGKFLTLAGDDSNSPDLYALVPVSLDIRTSLSETTDTPAESDEAEALAG